MADLEDKTIPELTAIDTPATGDMIVVTDISDTTDSATGSSKRSTLQQIADWLASLSQTLTNKTLTAPKINEDVAVTASATEINQLDGNILSGDNTGDEVEATGAEINIGTEQNKYASPKAIADSNVTTPTKTQTFTNKRVTWRVGTVTSHATPSINTDNYDEFTITALAGAITSMTSGLSGTPTEGQRLVIRIKDNGSAWAIAWGTSYRASTDLALPTTTILGKTMYCGFIYNATDAKWDLVAYLNNI